MQTPIVYADVCCALGDTLEESVTRLLAAEQRQREYRFDALQDPISVPYFGARGLDGREHPQRIYVFLEQMVAKALDELGLSPEQRQRTGIFIGSSSFDVNVSEQRFEDDLRAQREAVAMPIIGYGKIAARLQAAFDLGPHAATYSTACTSSANALLNAQRLMQADIIDHALVIGVEFFNQTTVLGFHGLNLISPSNRMAPFQPGRDGLVLGEGCSLLVLSTEGTSPVQLCGGAIATDNHSLTAANIDGSSIAAVIQQALSRSGITAADLAAIKVHGTASLLNDEAEAAGIRRLLDTPPALFALKPYIGHTLGACGALETALVYGCLSRGELPSNPAQPQAASPTSDDLGINLLPNNQPAPAGYYGLNYFAFGGNNTCLILHKAHA